MTTYLMVAQIASLIMECLYAFVWKSARGVKYWCYAVLGFGALTCVAALL